MKIPNPSPIRQILFLAIGGFAALPGLAELSAASSENAAAHEILIEGTVTRDDRGSYFLREFEVPEGTARIDVDFDHSHRGEGTEIEIGLFDPNGFRGTSRFSKTAFFIEQYAATPSYYPGRILPGTWKVSLALPSIRPGVTSSYTVRIRLTPGLGGGAYGAGPWRQSLRAGPAWFQGDFHSHTGHSDGFGCRDSRGERAPCQVFQVILAAQSRGLDFMAVTDHNTTSHHAELASLQPSFSELLLVRGQEVTTFHGHANVFGTSTPVDFRLGFSELMIDQVITQAHHSGGLFSINHPGRQTGERCTGCGWDAPGTDYSRVDAIEVVNSANIETPVAGAPFWHSRLNEGHRITGIGGSDDHAAATGRGRIGTPTTVVFAQELSEAAILEGVRAGHVFIKTRGPEGPDVRLRARGRQGVEAIMGDDLHLGGPGERVAFAVEVKNGKDQKLELIEKGESVDLPGASIVDSDDFVSRFELTPTEPTWYRLNLRDADGITVMTNPIYIRFQR